MANELLEAALEYRFKNNWSVIPLVPNMKIPPKDFDVIQFRDRFATKEEIEGWWKENPKYNVGVVTGKLSDILVVDFDKYKPEYKEEIALEYFSDTIETPCDISPRGGEHLFFKYPKDNVSIYSGILPGIDYRGEGGYCMIPPSTFEGKAGKWIIPPNGQPFASVPEKFLALINNIYTNTICKSNTDQNLRPDLLQPVTINLNKGTRDQSLFHIAHTMAKGGAIKEDIAIVLNIIAKECNPPFPPNEIVTKCNSAIERSERKDRNLKKELESYIAVTNGYFSVTDCYMALQVVTKEDKGAIRIALTRLKDKTIEKHGQKDGVYKRIETELEFVNFGENEPDDIEYQVNLPLELNKLSKVCQANIILVAGEFNAGKTTFVLNVLRQNINKLPIRYIFSEGGKIELKMRFATFGLPPNFFTNSKTTEFVKKSFDFHAAIKPDALNIIDYMEFQGGDYTLGAEYLRLINDKLTTGIAIIAIQKKQGSQLPRAGDLVMEKPRLVLGFSKINSNDEYPQGICEVLKCKMPQGAKADGKKLRYEIRDRGSYFKVLNEWGYWKNF